MLRSLYSAVSGVKAHQTYLDVTGNNIANVNTVGFKRDVIHFRDMIYQTSKNPSQPNPSIPIGGVNPAQVGLGVTVGSIETVHTQGSLQNTGIPTDMAIQGSGYFVVNNGTQQLYTRAGNFSLDRDGNLVMQGNGYLVQGYAYKDVIDPATGNLTREKDSNLTGINIPIGEKIPAKATTLAAFRCNLCSTATAEITDMTSIPGGETKVARPHDYTSYAGKEVTYVGDSAARTAKKGVSGETFFDTETGQIFEWGLSGASGWETNETVDDFGADVTTDPDTPSSIPIGYKYFNTNDMLLYVYTQGTYDAGRQTKVGAIVSQNP
ncbi:MAG: flagellar hook-basal body complex protein, partial [Synergistaceae bacterium]|nr:flagellar hook-basal body complex protein [Synergistaceae bacterium]